MMSVQNHAGLGKKLIIFIVVIIVVGGLGVGFWFFSDSLFGIGCSEFKESFFIESACNLNENEVVVNLIRSSDNINLDRIEFEFQPSDSLWKADGSKCLDVRLMKNKYGDYCELIKEEESFFYVFNVSLGKQESVKVWVKGNGMKCSISEVSVEEC